MLEYIDIKSEDVLLDIGGNTGKISKYFSKDCKEVTVLDPKHSIVEYGKAHRPYIKFVK